MSAGGALALWAAGCAATAAGVAPPAATARDSTAWTFVPAGAGVTRYGVPLGASGPTAPEAQRLLQRVVGAVEAAGRAPPVWDERLAAVARDVASVSRASGALGYSVVEFALHHHGIVEPTPHLIVFWTASESFSGLPVAERVRTLAAVTAYARVGIGVTMAGPQHVVVIALQASFLELQPLPRMAPVDARVVLRGRVLPPFVEPAVLVAADGEPVRSLAVWSGPRGRFSAVVRCPATPGPIRVEVSAVSERGASVLANFPIFCGTKPPDALVVRARGRAPLTAAQIGAAERRLAGLVNEERVRAGLPALPNDPRVARVARAYSAEMSRSGLVAHVSALTGTAADRLRAAGLTYAVVQENLARAASIEEAHQSLMNSPGHRANVLSRTATHLGIGIALGPNGGTDVLVTQLFVRASAAVALPRERRELEGWLGGAAGLDADPELDRLAQAHAEHLARGEAEASPSLAPLAKEYSHVRAVILSVPDLDHLPAERPGLAEGSTHLGMGLARGAPREGGGEITVVVILLGRHR